MHNNEVLFINKEAWRKTDDGSRKALIERYIVHLVTFGGSRTSILVTKKNLAMARKYLGKNPFVMKRSLLAA